MDKINRALAGTEDNAAQIAAIWAELRELKAARFCAEPATGAVVDGDAVRTVFGDFEVTGEAAFAVVYPGGATTLRFCGEQIAAGTSPLVGKLPRGSGTLSINGDRAGATAVVVGAVKKL